MTQKYQLNFAKYSLSNLNVEWISYFVGTGSGIFLAIFFQSWLFLFISAIISGLFTPLYKKGILYGAAAIFSVHSIFITYNVFMNQYLRTSSIYLDIIGYEGLNYFYMFLVMDVIAILIGVSGGYFGSTIHNVVIYWKEKKNS